MIYAYASSRSVTNTSMVIMTESSILQLSNQIFRDVCQYKLNKGFLLKTNQTWELIGLPQRVAFRTEGFYKNHFAAK